MVQKYFVETSESSRVGPHIELDVSQSVMQEFSPLSLQLHRLLSHPYAQCRIYTDRSPPYFSRPCDLLCTLTRILSALDSYGNLLTRLVAFFV